MCRASPSTVSCRASLSGEPMTRASRIAAVTTTARMARSLQAFLLAATVASCHAATRAPAGGVGLKPDAAEHIETASTAVAQLRRDIDALFADPALARGFWGVLVKSLETDETLYTLNARNLMMPASNMNNLTHAPAAEKLEWDSYDSPRCRGPLVAKLHLPTVTTAVEADCS